MSNYIVSARKYRPSTFASVVGQGALTTTLQNSIRSGRLAHAYLFCGPRGVGKTTCARIFAKTINCLRPLPSGDACEDCESCKAFNEQRSLNIYELDAASHNSVEDIRQLIESVAIPPALGRYKVYIVDEVHMLSAAAFNAFLKTLEEPPSHAIFILATTEKHKLLPTIISRCQIYDFSRISSRDIVAYLAAVADREGVSYEPEALRVIAEKADGGMRDALSIFDQVVSFCQGKVTYQQTLDDLGVLSSDYYFRVVDELLSCDIPGLLLTLNDVLARGFEGSLFMGGLNSHMRALLLSGDAQTLPLMDVSESLRQHYAEQSRRCAPRWLYKAIRRLTDCDINYRQSQNKRLLMELTLIEMAQDAAAEGDEASGLGPTKHALKPIFSSASNEATTQATPAKADTPIQNATPSAPPTTAGPVAPRNNSVVPPVAAGSFSIFHGGYINKQPATQTSALSLSAGGEQMELTQENLIVVWRELLRQLPREMAASAHRLDNVALRLMADGGSFEAMADNPSMAHLLRQMKPQVESYMAGRFARPLTMTIRELAADEGPKMLSRGDQLLAMRNENPALGSLVERLSLTME